MYFSSGPTITALASEKRNNDSLLENVIQVIWYIIYYSNKWAIRELYTLAGFSEAHNVLELEGML